MLEQLIERILPTIIAALELMGIFIVAVSALSAFGRYLKSLFTRTPCDVKFALANEVLPKSWTKVMRQSHFEFCIGQDLTHSIFL